MPEGSKRVLVYKDLIEHVLKEQRDMVSLERLEMFLAKAKRKYPMLAGLKVMEDRSIELSEDMLEDEEAALKHMSTVIACTFKALEMFMGSGNAKEMVLDSVDTYLKRHPEIEGLDLARYLPKKAGPGKMGDDDVGTVEDMGDGEDVSAEDILKPKDEGVPYYDEEKKEWVLRPAHIVKKVKEEEKGVLEPVLEEGALKRRKVFKRSVKKEPPKEVETYQWLQNDFEVGASYVVEGTGQEKNMLCAEFLKEGLEAGEEAIAIVGYSPKLLLTQMQKIGVVEKDLQRLHIIDWHTFKEKHVVDVSTTDRVHVVPKDPKHMGSVLTKVLGSMDRDAKKRAFVSVVSFALAFIDFETIYNFVQITKLKFSKGNVSALFTLEAGQHGKDVRGPLKEVTDGWIRVKEGLSGANTWKMKVDIRSFSKDGKVLRDVVIMRNGIVVLERKPGKTDKEALEELGMPKDIGEALGEEEVEEAERIDSYLLDKMEMWKGLGFNVGPLEEAVDDGEEAFKSALKDFEKKAERGLEIRGRLDEVAAKVRRIRDRSLEEEILGIRRMLRDLEDLDKADEGVTELEVRLRSRMAKETKRRDREKEIFRIRMEHWARQGYDTSGLDAIMDKDLETVNREFAAFRSVVNKLQQVGKELDKMDLLGHEEQGRAIRKRLMDVEGMAETMDMFEALKEEVKVKERIKETAESRRNVLMDEVFHWALEGYCVDLMEKVDIFREDLTTLENRLGRLRARIKRLKEAEDLLNSLDLTEHRREEVQLRNLLKDVDRVEEVERKVMDLQGKVRGKISGDVMALDANIERMRELEETWQKLKSRLLAESKVRKEGGEEGEREA